MRRMYPGVLVLSLLLCLAPSLVLAQNGSAPRKRTQESDLTARVDLLEKEVQELRSELARLRQQEIAAPAILQSEAQSEAPRIIEASLSREAPAHPAAPAPQDRPERTLLGGATLSGSLDVYYSYDAQQPVSGVSTLRLFDNQTKLR